MSELIKRIFEVKKSKPYIDYYKFHEGNIFGITKMSRRELMHSNFIAWALNHKSSHALGFYPISQFVKSIYSIQEMLENEKARKIPDSLIYDFYQDDFIRDVSIHREEPVPIGKNKKYIDILIEITTQDKILPIIIENKVDSGENGENKNQTDIYYQWAEKKYCDRTIYFEPIYIFLFPEYNKSKQNSSMYIRMTYQNLVDDVLDPSLDKCGDIVAIRNYQMYLQCLSFQSDNEKGEETMAISAEEKRILNDFIAKNRDLLCAIIDELNITDESIKSEIQDGIKYQYTFENETYGVGPLVLAVVKKYVSDHPGIDFQELETVFPKKIRGGSGVVQLSKNVPDKDKGIGIDGKKRYFVGKNDKLNLSGEEVLVSNQWTKDKVVKFIEVATDLGYVIKQV